MTDLLQQAIQHHRAGEFSQAESLYRAILQTQPNHPDANHNLGVLAVAMNKSELALPFFKLALETNPNQAQFWLSYIDALIKTEQFDLAREVLKKGLERSLNGEKVEQLAIYLNEPTQIELEKLLFLFNEGKYTEVELFAYSLIQRFPNHGFCWKVLGTVLQKLGHLEKSLEAKIKAVQLSPNDADAHYNLGNTFQDLRRWNDAKKNYLQAIAIEPNYAKAHYNLGNIFRKLECLQDAEKCYRTAITIKPDYVEAYVNLGNLLSHQGDVKAAELCYYQVTTIKPDYANAHSHLLGTYNYNANHLPEFCLAEAKRFGQIFSDMVKQRFIHSNHELQPQRLRIGFVSGDFLTHPLYYFLEGLLTKIDTTKIELFAYSTNKKTDEVTQQMKSYFAAWKPIFDLDDKAAANLIYEDGIHILVDLSGHTTHNRLPIFAWKPAPIQVSWLGYFATTGIIEMDYILVDEIGVPDENKWHFTEKVSYLPNTRLCFSVPKFSLSVNSLPALDNDFITFGCFQNLSKVTDDVLELWGKILTQLPTARLRFQSKQLHEKIIVEQLYSRLARYGIEANRVETHAASSYKNYLVAHSQIDFILDTFPYSGGTTTCEALWMGVPTLTLAGETLLARQGASLLTAARLDNWIATDTNDYVAKAVSFTNDIQALAKLRASLREQVLNSPLFDAKQFAKNFENALWKMWHTYSQV
jgi:predicted O-linked N-acetylglucosamine transferase (SPINDLY family)